tara:strand:+ start:9126 stop:10028 length:903 start_codon:yes stop_codon:yes gene_type:complete
MSATKFTTYNQIGIKEDVSDLISDISPTDTPFVSSLKNEKVSSRTYEWQEDALDAAGANAHAEGATAPAANQVATTMQNNTTQILMKTVKVSGTADAVATHGRAKETAYQLGKKLKEIKRDYERACVGIDNGIEVGDDESSPTAREFKSASQMITRAIDAGSNANDALTEGKLLELGQGCYEAGSEPTMLMIKPADALLVAGFVNTTAGRNREIQDSKTLVNAIELLVTPFGEYRVVINRHQASDLAFLLDPTMWCTTTLRPFSRTLLAKDGDSDSHLIVGEVGLKHKSFADGGKITGLS